MTKPGNRTGRIIQELLEPSQSAEAALVLLGTRGRQGVLDLVATMEVADYVQQGWLAERVVSQWETSKVMQEELCGFLEDPDGPPGKGWAVSLLGRTSWSKHNRGRIFQWLDQEDSPRLYEAALRLLHVSPLDGTGEFLWEHLVRLAPSNFPLMKHALGTNSILVCLLQAILRNLNSTTVPSVGRALEAIIPSVSESEPGEWYEKYQNLEWQPFVPDRIRQSVHLAIVCFLHHREKLYQIVGQAVENIDRVFVLDIRMGLSFLLCLGALYRSEHRTPPSTRVFRDVAQISLYTAICQGLQDPPIMVMDSLPTGYSLSKGEFDLSDLFWRALSEFPGHEGAEFLQPGFHILSSMDPSPYQIPQIVYLLSSGKSIAPSQSREISRVFLDEAQRRKGSADSISILCGLAKPSLSLSCSGPKSGAAGNLKRLCKWLDKSLFVHEREALALLLCKETERLISEGYPPSDLAMVRESLSKALPSTTVATAKGIVSCNSTFFWGVLTEFIECLDLCSTPVEVVSELATCLTKCRGYSPARRSMKRLFQEREKWHVKEKVSSEWGPWRDFSEALLDLGLWREAEAFLKELTSIADENDDFALHAIHTLLGRVFDRRGLVKEAIAHYREAMEHSGGVYVDDPHAIRRLTFLANKAALDSSGGLPFPLSWTWRKVRLDDLPTVHNLFRAAEQLARFLLLLLLSERLGNTAAEAVDVSRTPWSEFRGVLRGRLSFGRVCTFLGSLGSEKSAPPSSMSELVELVGKKSRKGGFLTDLMSLVELRNELEHQVPLSDESLTHKAREVQPKVEALFKEASFLCTYNMVVLKSRDLSENGRVTWLVRSAMGSDPLYLCSSSNLEEPFRTIGNVPLAPGDVLIVPASGSPIRLWPFVRYLFCKTCGQSVLCYYTDSCGKTGSQKARYIEWLHGHSLEEPLSPVLAFPWTLLDDPSEPGKAEAPKGD